MDTERSSYECEGEEMTNLLLEFLLLGIVTFGGGMGMIPLLLDVVIKNGWMNESQFSNLVAISQSTPGPIAINMATFIGYQEFGVSGAVLASLTLVLPGFVVATLLSQFLIQYKDSERYKTVLRFMQSAVLGLLMYAVFFLTGEYLKYEGFRLAMAVLMLVSSVVIQFRFKMGVLPVLILFAVLGVVLL